MDMWMDIVTQMAWGEECKLYLQDWEENSCTWQKSGPGDELSQIALKHTFTYLPSTVHLQYFLLPSKGVQLGQ